MFFRIFNFSRFFRKLYTFIEQDAAQSFYYNNNQYSLRIIVIHYNESDSKIKHKSIVFFSDNLIHDAVALYLIREIIIKYIKKSFSFVKEVIKSALKIRLSVYQVALSGTVYIALATLVR